jgi:recombinational DNA repair ATPase RecF
MYIESLHVENVGPFNKLDVQFNPKMNVIVGANGVGKTSLLRCIADSLTSNSLEIMRFRQGATIKMNGFVGDKSYT